MDIQKMQKNVRAIHGLWLKEHLDHYIFISQPAKELKEKIESYNIENTTDADAIKFYYIQFVSMFQNNPYLVMNGLVKKDELHIISEYYEYYLTENDSQVPVPIQYAKEKSSPRSQEYNEQIGYHLKQQSEYAITTAQKMSGNFTVFANQRNRALAAPQALDSSNLILTVISLVLGLVCLISFIALAVSLSGKHIITILTGIVSLILLVYAGFVIGRILISAIQHGERVGSMKADIKNFPQSIEEIVSKIPGQCGQLRFFSDNYFSGNEVKEKENMKYSYIPAGAYIAGEIPFDSQKEILTVSPEEIAKEVFGKKAKKAPAISPVLPIVLSVFCIFLFLLLGLKQIGFLVAPVSGQNSMEGTLSNKTQIVGTYDVYVAAPVCNLRSKADAADKNNIIGTYNKGTGLYLVDKTVNSSGTSWLKVKDEKGKTGWVSRKVVSFFDPDKIVLKSASASSELPTKNGDKGAASAIDGYLQSSWQEGIDGDGTSESITVTFDSQTVSGFAIVNGNVTTEDAYHQNGRLKQAEITFDNGEKTIVDFKDNYDYEGYRFQLEKPVKASSMTVKILSVYSGSKYKDTCITEIELYKDTQ